MSQYRVVVTGMGTVNPVANSVPEFWAGLLAGKSGIAKLAKIDHADLPDASPNRSSSVRGATLAGGGKSHRESIGNSAGGPTPSA